MSFKRVLLITPPVQTETGSLRPSIGLGYIAEVLEAASIEYDVLDMMLGYDADDLLKKLDDFKPDLLGVNLFSNKYLTAYDTIRVAKAHRPSMKVIAGGPHVSCYRESVMEGCPSIDYLVSQEGEVALVELCEGKPEDSILGLMYRHDEEIRYNGDRPLNKELDTLPFPRYEKFELDRYIAEKSIIASRGCPYGCTFCAVGKTIGKPVRVRSAGDVVDEMEYWYKKGTRQFSFQDDNFTFYRDNFFAICDAIEERGMNDLFLRCAAARADKLDDEILARMKEVGFRTIAMGVEAGNNRMLKILKKGETMETIDEAVRLACLHGFDVYLNFLLGSPGETEADVRDSFKFAEKYPVFYADFFNIMPYPSTEMFDSLERDGLLMEGPEEYLNSNSTQTNIPVFTTPELSFDDRVRLLRESKSVRQRILRNGMKRRFAERGVPALFGAVAAAVLSWEWVSAMLFHNRVRRVADLIRFRLYMKKEGAEGSHG